MPSPLGTDVWSRWRVNGVLSCQHESTKEGLKTSLFQHDGTGHLSMTVCCPRLAYSVAAPTDAALSICEAVSAGVGRGAPAWPASRFPEALTSNRADPKQPRRLRYADGDRPPRNSAASGRGCADQGTRPRRPGYAFLPAYADQGTAPRRQRYGLRAEYGTRVRPNVLLSLASGQPQIARTDSSYL